MCGADGSPQDSGIGRTLRIAVRVWYRSCGLPSVPHMHTPAAILSVSPIPLSCGLPSVPWYHTHTAILIVCPDSMIMSAVVIASLCSDYSDYFDAIPIQAMINQSLFWSGTLSLVEIVSMMNAMGVNVVSSANVPSSEIINNIPPSVGSRLSWCGNENGEYYTLLGMHA